MSYISKYYILYWSKTTLVSEAVEIKQLFLSYTQSGVQTQHFTPPTNATLSTNLWWCGECEHQLGSSSRSITLLLTGKCNSLTLA